MGEKKSNLKVILIVIIVIVAIPVVILPLLGVVAALTIPSLANRQEEVAAVTRIKKAVSSYEAAASVYMAENDTNNVYGLSTNNCKQASNYFKITEGDGCNFTTVDGIYWQFNQDGSAKISDNAVSPKITVKVGVCKDGIVNCENEYSEVRKILTGQN